MGKNLVSVKQTSALLLERERCVSTAAAVTSTGAASIRACRQSDVSDVMLCQKHFSLACSSGTLCAVKSHLSSIAK